MTWPLSDAGMGAQGGSVAGTSLLTTITASATPHTPGSWVEMVPATSWVADMLWLQIGAQVATSATDTSSLVDIGVGGSGSEIVLVADIPVGYLLANSSPAPLPRRVPAGSRLSLRLRSAVVSKTATAQLRLAGGGLHAQVGYGRSTTYGADQAASSGTAVTPPGATNTKSAWTVIDAATAHSMRAVTVCVTTRPDTSMTTKDCLFDVGVGEDGSEVVLVADVVAAYGLSEAIIAPYVCQPVDVPAGSRLVARYQSTSTADAPAVVVIGFD